MLYKDHIQKVNISQEAIACQECGVNILDIANFKYSGKMDNGPTYREEHCTCRKCGADFILRYDLFDGEGHIHPRTFSEDVNDPSYTWQEILTQEQKDAIAEHLKSCPICNDRLAEEHLLDAWFASYVHEKRK